MVIGFLPIGKGVRIDQIKRNVTKKGGNVKGRKRPKTCDSCHKGYPRKLIQRFTALGPNIIITAHGEDIADMQNERIVEKCCPICALKLSNEATGLKRKDFDGPIAKQYLKEAIEYDRRREA